MSITVTSDLVAAAHLEGMMAALAEVEKLASISQEQHRQSYAVGVLTARDKIRALISQTESSQ